MKKYFFGMIAIVLVALLLSGCHEESERNKIGSSIDWGDGYYWDSSSESVRSVWD